MTVQDFLKDKDNLLNLSDVARRMWPKNETARMYLDKKLNGSRPWTEKDTVKAKAILKSMAIKIDNLE